MARLSYSLIRSYKQYKKGELCGVLLYNALIEKSCEMPINKEAVNAGKWFEKQATGYGEDIEPVRIKSGELNAMYRALNGQLKNFDNFRLKWERPDTCFGVILEYDHNGIQTKAIIDVLSSEYIRDIKTSGDIDGRGDFGWGGDIRFKPQIDQAKMYIWIVWKMTGNILPFYFDIY